MTPQSEIDRHVGAPRRDGFSIVPDAIGPTPVGTPRRNRPRIARERLMVRDAPLRRETAAV